MTDKMKYDELVKIVEKNDMKYSIYVMAYLIGYKGSVDRTDWENINRLCSNGLVKK